jgi:hypothetical protein
VRGVAEADARNPGPMAGAPTAVPDTWSWTQPVAHAQLGPGAACHEDDRIVRQPTSRAMDEPLLNHAIGALHQRLRDHHAERLGRSEIDDQLEFARALHW